MHIYIYVPILCNLFGNGSEAEIMWVSNCSHWPWSGRCVFSCWHVHSNCHTFDYSCSEIEPSGRMATVIYRTNESSIWKKMEWFSYKYTLMIFNTTDMKRCIFKMIYISDPWYPKKKKPQSFFLIYPSLLYQFLKIQWCNYK